MCCSVFWLKRLARPSIGASCLPSSPALPPTLPVIVAACGVCVFPTHTHYLYSDLSTDLNPMCMRRAVLFCFLFMRKALLDQSVAHLVQHCVSAGASQLPLGSPQAGQRGMLLPYHISPAAGTQAAVITNSHWQTWSPWLCPIPFESHPSLCIKFHILIVHCVKTSFYSPPPKKISHHIVSFGWPLSCLGRCPWGSLHFLEAGAPLGRMRNTPFPPRRQHHYPGDHVTASPCHLQVQGHVLPWLVGRNSPVWEPLF